MIDDPWIIVPNWDKFQHYKDRYPPWIKLYTELNSRDDWLSLSDSSRGLLALIWIEFARSSGQQRYSKLPSNDRQKNRRRTLERLRDAGFIDLSATKPTRLVVPSRDARARSREVEVLRTSTKSALAREPTEAARARAQEERKIQPRANSYEAAEQMTRTIGCQMPLASYRDELDRFNLANGERELLETLWQQLSDEDW
jgi:hypothetical protein